MEEFTHPKFKDDPSYDIALLKLNGSVEFNEYIRPACLSQPDSYISQQLIEISWSDTDIRDKELQKMKSTLISNTACNEEIMNGGYEEYAQGVKNEITFCAVPNVEDRNMCGVRKMKFCGSNSHQLFILRDLMVPLF